MAKKTRNIKIIYFMQLFIFFRPFILLVLIAIFGLSCSLIFKENPINTIDNYEGAYYKLMWSVKKGNVEDIKKIVVENHLVLNYADETNGVSLLNWCIFNNKKEAFKELLLLGANPNWQDSGGLFAPAIIEASKLSTTNDYLILSLKYRGNPNCISKKIEGSENQTPLFGTLYSGNLKNVKMIVENGANVNLTIGNYWSPLADALMHNKIEIAKYLIEKGANYNELKFKTRLGKDLNILDFLRNNEFILNSNEYQIKLNIIILLKNKGLDYWKYPIPEEVKKRHMDEPEYLLYY